MDFRLFFFSTLHNFSKILRYIYLTADKAGITHDFLSLGKEQPRSPGHAGGGPAIDLNVLAVKPEWSTCQTRIGTAESSGASTCRRFPYSLGKVDVTPGAGIFPSSSRRNPMDASSRLKGFADEEEEDDEEFLKETPLKGLSIKVDGSSNSGDDRKPSTPRSKHSATEQRRRSKINDRFQILRSLIPNTDQKRDKASFLLEVIEYIQLLQEKVNKYESPYPVWNQDNTKLTPWKSSQILPDGGAELQQYAPCGPVGSNGPSGSSGGFGYYHSQPRSVAGPTDNGQASWARSSPSILADSREDDLVIEGGTISLSSTYSEGLLTTLTQALQSSGVDLSTASLSVRVNLGRQAIGRDLERSSGDDSEQRQRPVKRKSANR